MQFFAAFKTLIPEIHAFSDEDKRYNVGATWTVLMDSRTITT
jgi:hypothetical protein